MILTGKKGKIKYVGEENECRDRLIEKYGQIDKEGFWCLLFLIEVSKKKNLKKL